MAPTLLNLYAFAVSKKSQKNLGIDDVDTLLLCNLDDQLFNRSTKNARGTLFQRGNLLIILFCWHIQGLLRVLPSGSVLR